MRVSQYGYCIPSRYNSQSIENTGIFSFHARQTPISSNAGENPCQCLSGFLTDWIKVGLIVAGGVIGSIVPVLGPVAGGAIGSGIGSVAGQLIVDHQIDPVQAAVDTATGGLAPGVGTVAENIGANIAERIFGKQLGGFLAEKLLPRVIGGAVNGMILGDTGTVIRDGMTGHLDYLAPDLWRSTKRGAFLGGVFGAVFSCIPSSKVGTFSNFRTFLEDQALPARKIGAMATRPPYRH